jgi:hypothetical protein
MYEVDDKDVVVVLEGVPQSSVGAPNPCVLADEHTVVLAYYAQNRSAPWTGIPRMVGPVDSNEPIVIVRLDRRTHMFGQPNDEAFAGHPLAKRGLKPYGAFRIDNSSWIRRLERMNSVHRLHRAENYWKLQHLVFSFHDSTFECVCLKFDIRTAQGSISDVIPEMVKLLDWGQP